MFVRRAEDKAGAISLWSWDSNASLLSYRVDSYFVAHPKERFFYTQEKLLTIKRRKGRKLSMIYPEAFAQVSPKKLQLSRAFALIMPILQGRVFKMKSLA